MSDKSYLEETLALQLRAFQVSAWEREYRFAKVMGRDFRLDFAFPALKLGVEVQGGIWRKGAHSSGAGLQRDYEKGNMAIELGWWVLQYDRKSVITGIAIQQIMRVVRALEEKEKGHGNMGAAGS